MAATLQLRRGPAANLAGAAAADGEPLWTTDTRQLYVGYQGAKYLVGGVSTKEGLWRFGNVLTMADPGAGRFRMSAAAITSVTQLAVSKLTDGGTDMSNTLKSLAAGDLVQVQDRDNAANWARFTVSAVTNNTSWFLLAVSLTTPTSYGGAPPANNAVCVLSFSASGGGGGGGGVSVSDTATIDLSLAGTTVSGVVVPGSITDAHLAAGAATVAKGGTGITAYTAGDLLVATGPAALGRLAVGSAGQVLGVVSGAPAWTAAPAPPASPGLAQCRLSLQDGVPVTSADVTGAGTVYLNAYRGGHLALYDGAAWAARPVAGTISLSADAYSSTSSAAGTTAAGSPVMTMASTAGLHAGDVVSGPNLPTLPTRNLILRVDSATQITLNKNASAAGTNTYYFYPGAHDVYAYWNAGLGQIILEALAWDAGISSPPARGVQDGILVKASDPTRRYLGTFRAAGFGLLDDNATARGLWNYYNRLARPMMKADATASWTQSAAGWRPANNNPANCLDYVCGLDEDPVSADVFGMSNATQATNGAVGIGLDSTTAPQGVRTGAGNSNSSGVRCNCAAGYRGFPGAGGHTLYWLEYRELGTMTWYGSGVSNVQTGIVATVMG